MIRALVIALALLVATSSARAQDELTLQRVLESVSRHAPALAMARREVDIADGEALSADGAFDPAWRTRGAMAIGTYDYARIDTNIEQATPWWGTRFFLGYRIGRGNIPVYYGEYGTAEYGEIRGGVMVPLWRDGPIDRRRANIARAELSQRLAGLSVEQQRIELTRLATQRYWDWVSAGLRLQAAEQWLQVAELRNTQLSQRAERGDIPRIELTENQRAILQRQGAVISATRSLEQASIELSMFWRDDAGHPVLARRDQLPDGLPEPEPIASLGALSQNEELALERRPDGRRIGLLGEQLRIERDWANNQRAPAIDIMAVGSHDFGAPLDVSKLYGPQFDATLTLEIPILNRTANGRVQAAEAGLARLTEQRELVDDRIRADVRDASSAMQAAIARTELARQELSVARDLEQAEQQRFELGDTTLLVVNMREQATVEAQVRVIEALAEYHRSRAAHAAAMGTANVE